MSKKVLLIDDSSGEYLPVGNGTTGYILTSNGTSDAPSWQSNASTAYDLQGNTVGTYENNEIVYRLPAVRAFNLTATNTDHNFKAVTGPAGAGGAIVKLKIAGGVDLLTATFAQNATTATVVVNNTAVAEDQEVQLVMPAAADASLASVYFTAKGNT